MKKLGIFCLLFIIALSSCRDNIDEVDTTEIPYEPPIVNWDPQTRPVEGSVTGFVVDEAGEPVAGAIAKMGNLTTTTDDYGHFFFEDVQLNALGTVINIEKAGYFNGSRRFFAVEDQTNRVKVELISKSFDYSFDASSGGQVQTTDGASITFSPNSIKKEDGTIYIGNVRVAAKWLNPADVRTMDQMPGNLQGVDREAEEVALQTYGMVAVELESDAGEALNISEGNTATLSMPVPSDLQASAPAEIPLWSFNEEHGIWVEESVATLSGGVYTGEVSHFSFWNCDYPGELIEFSATLVDPNGNALNNHKVAITMNTANGPFVGTGYTCPDGTITGLIPANVPLLLEIYGICAELLHAEDIGSFSDDVDLGTIVLNSSSLNTITVEGELVDCNGAAVSNGLVIVKFDGQAVYDYVTGNAFSLSFSTCQNSSDPALTGVDLDELVQSDPVSIGNVPGGTYDVGQVEVCDVQLEDVITVSVDDGSSVVTAVYTPSYVFMDSTIAGNLGTGFSYYGNNPNNTTNIYFNTVGTAVGDYSNGNAIFSFTDNDNQWNFGQNQTFSSFEITEYGAAGEPIIGTFGGTLINYAVQPPATVTVNGTFNITR